MSSSELLTDAYLIELLQRDAQRKIARRSDAPKPNTRFLRNIVRDVDSHNSALKAREEADARARQRRLRREERPSRNQEEEEEEEQERRRRRRRRAEEEDDEGRARSRKHRDGRQGSRSRSPRKGKDRGEGKEREGHRKHSTNSQLRSRSPARSSRRGGHKHHHHHPSHTFEGQTASSEHKQRHSRSPSPASSTSDPPEDVLGPQPLPPHQSLPRGRGAFKPQTSSIETRFREGYDPKTDAQEEEYDVVEDDWDRGLEAVRDRAKWRENGAERLRAAGFTEQEVKNWERGAAGGREDAGREKNVGDVRWIKKGEGVREWDRGKGEDGKADWIGRLTRS